MKLQDDSSLKLVGIRMDFCSFPAVLIKFVLI